MSPMHFEETVTTDATAESALVLGIIVLVRTFLSVSLKIELEGVVPTEAGVRHWYGITQSRMRQIGAGCLTIEAMTLRGTAAWPTERTRFEDRTTLEDCCGGRS
jgi:uncharacterized protein DUF1622